MKKVLVILGLLIATVFATQVKAQKVGIKGGVNFSNMASRFESNDELVAKDREFLVGWNIGLSSEIDFHENFGFEAELIFNSKGYKYTIEDPISKSDVVNKTRFVYLDIPVSAKGMYNITDGVQVFGKFGPYVGIGLVGKNTTELLDANGDRVGSKKEIDIKWGEEGAFNRFDYGLNMGLGAEIGGFLVEGVYKFSLGDVDNSDLTRTKNHVFMLSVGYNLDFKKILGK